MGFVSVIIPTYNRGWIVRDAIDSVLGQTYADVELIVVDDGSTDRTPDILNSYGDRLRVIRQANQGVSAARNRGIDNTSGPLIALLDSDDIWLPKKLAVQIDFFKRNPAALSCQTEEIWIRYGLRVNPGKRLIEQYELRIVNQRPCDCHTLLLTTGEFIRAVVKSVAQPHRLQRDDGAVLPLKDVQPIFYPVQHRQHHVLECRDLAQQAERLKDEADLPVPDVGQIALAQLADVLSIKVVSALSWPVETSQNIHQGRLSGSA